MKQEAKADRANWKLFALGVVGILLLVIASMAIGKYYVPPSAILRVLFTALTGPQTDVDPIQQMVIWNVRLPRVAAGLLMGAALAAAGATYQGLFRNPLVSPDILGVTPAPALARCWPSFSKCRCR